METFSALLALCVGNSSVTGEFPAQRPVTRSFDVSFDLHLNKRLNKHLMTSSNGNFSALLAICAGIHRSPMHSPHKGQWHGALKFSLICAWINGWINKCEAGDLRRRRVHYVIIVMEYNESQEWHTGFPLCIALLWFGTGSILSIVFVYFIRRYLNLILS